MTDYNKYVLAVNKIFEVIAKIKQGYTETDNLNHISNIEEYKKIVVKAAEKFSNEKSKSSVITEQPNMKKVNDVEEI